MATKLATKTDFWEKMAPKITSNYTKKPVLLVQSIVSIARKKQDFKKNDLLITAWSRVQVLDGPPKLDTRFDTMRIEAGVQFLFAKAPVCKGFPHLLTKVGSTVTAKWSP